MSCAATLTADCAGAVAATVRIPFAATGFTPQGAEAGVVFVDAIGLDPAGSHRAAGAMAGLAPHGSHCGAVDALPFSGFEPPVRDLPAVGAAQPGRTIPVKFATPGFAVPMDQVLKPGYPQSAPVSCSDPAMLTAGTPTAGVASSSDGDAYRYEWKTDKAWRGCRELIVGLVDGTYHRAVVDFG